MNFPDTPVTLLVKLAQQLTCHSDDMAWERLFDLYAPAIRKFAVAQGGADDAEDVVQEVFMKLVNILREGKVNPEAGKFRCYLATMIRRELIDLWRKRQVRAAGQHVSLDDEEANLELVAPSEIEARLDAKWRLARHEAAVEHVLARTALSQQSKDVYRMYVVEEHPVREVMDRFNLSRNSVYQIKTRVERMIALIESEYED